MTIDEHSGGTFAMIGDVLEALTLSPESFEIDRIFVSGDIGSETPLEYRIAAEGISRLEIGGDLTAEVTAGPRADNSDSDIFLIDVGGTLVGDVYALHGSIGTIAVAENIGWPEQMTYVLAMHGIDSIDAGTVNAWLAATLEDPMSHINHIHITGEFTGQIWTAALEDSLTVPNPGATFESNCVGNLYLGRLDVPVVIEGDVTGELYTNGILPGVTLDIMGSVVDAFVINWFGGLGGLGGLIRIAGDLDGDSSFYNFFSTIAYESTPGQVIINAANDGGEWIGPGYVDPLGVLLDPVPAYANEDLIGAVGQVPFRLHDGDCIPENGDTFAFNDGLVILRFYSPVTWDEIFPFNISRGPGGSSCDPVSENARWMNVSGQGTRTITLQYVDTSKTPAEIPSGRRWTRDRVS